MKKHEYVSIWEKRRAEEKAQRNLAIKKAKKVAKILKAKYGAKEVILFGSLIWRPEFIWRGTDIDLLVKGLQNKRYFEILADISSISNPFSVDLIPMEKARTAVRRRVIKDGWRLE